MLYLSLALYHVGVSKGGNVVRALYIGICATTLLLSLFNGSMPMTSVVTTASSALVAPYLDRPTGYIRPSIAASVLARQQYILTLARLHNHPQLTHFDEREFAAVMVTILYTEQLGWLEDVVPSIRPLTPYYQEAQVISNDYIGTNFSVWPANLRPSVVDEIISNQVPAVGIVELHLLIPRTMQHKEYANQLAYNTDTAFALLAANLERGIIRATHEHVPITWKTLLAWHNAGIVDPQHIAQNRSLQHYLKRAAIYHVPATALYLDNSLCLNPITASTSHASQSEH